MSQPVVACRHIEERDIPSVLDCEYASHRYTDPDFGTPTLPVYAWNHADLMAGIGQYKARFKGENDTRTRVAEVMKKEAGPDGLAVERLWVCGAVLYELKADRYEVLLLTAHPDAPPAVRDRLLDELLGKAERSDRRKTVAVNVPDGDYATLRYMQKRGAKVTLKPSRESSARGGYDTWCCEFGVGAGKRSPSPARS